mgnify:CR=1 FL=1
MEKPRRVGRDWATWTRKLTRSRSLPLLASNVHSPGLKSQKKELDGGAGNFFPFNDHSTLCCAGAASLNSNL